MTSSPSAAGSSPYVQSIAGCLDGAIGANGLDTATLTTWLAKLSPALERLKEDYSTGRLPVLTIPEETADIDEAAEALARLSAGAGMIIFFGTGGSGLGGQTLAQVGGWNLPGVMRGRRARTSTHALLRQPRSHDAHGGAR